MNVDDLRTRYLQYIDLCNTRNLGRLAKFVADDVVASETAEGLDAYVAGIEAVVQGFSDYYWDVEQVLVDGDCIAARLTGTGTHTGTFCGVAATQRRIRIQELAVYRTSSGKITRCWGDLGSVIRDELVSNSAD